MRNINKILLFVVCCFVNVSFCYAAAEVNFNFTDPGTGGNSNSNNNNDNGNGNGSLPSDSFKFDSDKYTCSYNYSITPSATITLDGFNKDNQSIITGNVTPKESVKAGTSIGISIREIKGVSWKVTNVKVTGSEKTYYAYWCPPGADVAGKYDIIRNGVYLSGYSNNSGLEAAGCSYGGPYTISDPDATNNNAELKQKCENEAKKRVKAKAQSYISSSSYRVKLRDPNDANSSVEVEILAIKTDETIKENSIKRTFTYSPKYVCINKATAEVFYKNDACKADEFRILNDSIGGTEHFHYFIPMDVTDGEFSLLLANKGQEEFHSKDWCVKAINSNQYYYDFLFVSSGGGYTRLSDNKSIAKREVKNGCYLRTEIRIPVSDGYFAIDKEENKINNFNFYFKTINESDPFPNQVTNKNSLWYDWYDQNYVDGVYTTNKVVPNILDSYKEIKYLVKNVNAKEIRDYNNNKNNYSDKSGYLNNSITSLGVSKFIDEFQFTRNNVKRYKLGCGPLNKGAKLSDGTDNPLFQEGCN